MPTSMTSDKRTIAVLGVLAATSAATGVTIALLMAKPEMAEAAEPGDRDQLATLAVMRSAQSSDDMLPDSVDPMNLGTEGLLPSSTRLLHANEHYSYWAALDSSGSLCLVAEISADEVFGASCGGSDILNERGLALQIFGPTDATEAYLVPDGLSDALATTTPGFESENLLVVEPLKGDEKIERFNSAVGNDFASGSQFEILPLSDPSPEHLPESFQHNR